MKQSSKKRRRRSRRTVRDIFSELHVPLHVADIAVDAATRAVVRRIAGTYELWPLLGRRKLLGRRNRLKAPFDYRRIHKPVKATIEIDYPLTDAVPTRMRIRTRTIRGEGDALVIAADMYLAIYREEERRGGDRALNPDIEKRLRERKRHGSYCMNRAGVALVWGHDLEDLVFERLYLKWLDAKHTKAKITFAVGS